MFHCLTNSSYIRIHRRARGERRENTFILYDFLCVLSDLCGLKPASCQRIISSKKESPRVGEILFRARWLKKTMKSSGDFMA